MMLKRWWNPLRFLQEGARYGDVVCFVPNRFYMVNHPDHVRRVLLERREIYRKDPRRPAAKEDPPPEATGERPPADLAADDRPDYRFVGGQSVALSEGKAWRRQRTMVQPIFSRRGLVALSTAVTEETARMLRGWEAKASQERPVDVERESVGLVLRILVRSLLGEDAGTQTDKIIQAIADTHHFFEARSRSLLRTPRTLPTPANLRFRRAFGALTEVFYRAMDERARMQRQDPDLLGFLLQARDRDTGQGLTRRQLHDEMLMLSLLGHKTTALALTWTLYLLDTAPVVEQRLHEEFVSVLDGRSPTVDDLPRLTYARQVLEESMRLYPPAWLIGRVALEDDELGGYLLPARATVVLSPYLLHRHPGFWEEPETFDPGRFSPERSTGRPRFVYVPFGEGDRACVASTFAMMQLSMILAEVLRAYRLKLVPGRAVRPEVRVVLRPRRGLPMTLHPRRAAG